MPQLTFLLIRIGLLGSLFWMPFGASMLLNLPAATAAPTEQAVAVPWEGVTVKNVAQNMTESPAQVIARLATAQVVYLGEIHDRPADHAAQRAIIQALHTHRPRLIIAMEMFQRPAQPLLNAYLADKLTETQLKTRSEYQKRWGFPWEFYAPVLRFAQTNRLPVIALNTPSEVTRKVARQGLESLTWPERRFIPPLGAIALGPPAYRQRLLTIYESFHTGKTNSQSFDRFFQAQVLWDETMAERIADTAKRYPDALIIVLAGQGHIVYGEGIPDRVLRRSPHLQQARILLNPEATLTTEPPANIADYFWISAKE
jgi:uncharacterized iron-regulated protein